MQPHSAQTKSQRAMSEASKMHKSLRIVSLLICAPAISSCATHGQAAKHSACPTLPPAPAALMQVPTTGQAVRAELLQPQTPQTRK